ncbi:MAG: hypothetical protein P9L96_04375 [Candidatus Gygaella obscura]|nr:hypothetical protein [Candidatus Gygaella obscura]
MKKVFSGILALFLCLSVCGCWPLFIGVGALGGYAISKDTIQGEVAQDVGSVWGAAIKVSEITGIIRAEDRTKGTLAVEVDRNNVNIRIEELTKNTVRLRVSARTKYLLPNINLAQKIYIKISREFSAIK